MISEDYEPAFNPYTVKLARVAWEAGYEKGRVDGARYEREIERRLRMYVGPKEEDDGK